MSNEWLEKLKPNDIVIVYNVGLSSKKILRKIKRITKTQIMISMNSNYVMKFNKKYGKQIGGDSFNRYYLEEATPENIKIIEAKNRLKYLDNKFKTTDWTKFKLNELEKINDFIKNEIVKQR